MGRMPAVIRCHVVYSVLAGTLLQFAQDCALSVLTMDAFISSIRAGNAEGKKANLGGELLGVRYALNVLSFTGIHHHHHERGTLIAGVCLETSPFKVVAAFLAQVVGKIWDGHLYTLEL